MARKVRKKIKRERPNSPFGFKKRPCRFCKDERREIRYDDVEGLKLFVTERGKIVPRRISGNCAKHQRLITNGVKRARILGFLPFAIV